MKRHFFGLLSLVALLSSPSVFAEWNPRMDDLERRVSNLEYTVQKLQGAGDSYGYDSEVECKASCIYRESSNCSGSECRREVRSKGWDKREVKRELKSQCDNLDYYGEGRLVKISCRSC